MSSNDGNYGYVYLITNRLNLKMYVGMHKSNKLDLSYYGSGTAISNAVRKYGKENFTIEVLHWCTTPAELQKMELYELQSRNVVNDPLYYNIIDTTSPILFGKDNGFYGRTHSNETKEKLSEHRLGIPLSAERKEQLKLYWDTPAGIQRRYQLSIERKGCPLSHEHKENIKHSCTTDEFRRNISEQKQKYWANAEESSATRIRLSELATVRFIDVPKTKEHAQRISDALKGRPRPQNQVINRNPEKIRKTAESNTGKKRSAETKALLSELKKGKPTHNKGAYYAYHTETLEIKTIYPGEELPNGFAKGRKPKV